jgi:cytochrome c-type biogenesis protein CcmH/NrfG
VVLWAVPQSRTREALRLGDADRTEVGAERLVALSPAIAQAWSLLGQVRVEAEKIESVLEAYLHAVRCAPPTAHVA